jgi:hypothetical protein
MMIQISIDHTYPTPWERSNKPLFFNLTPERSNNPLFLIGEVKQNLILHRRGQTNPCSVWERSNKTLLIPELRGQTNPYP